MLKKSMCLCLCIPQQSYRKSYYVSLKLLIMKSNKSYDTKKDIENMIKRYFVKKRKKKKKDIVFVVIVICVCTISSLSVWYVCGG